MIYYFDGKARFLLGAEKIKQVQNFTNNYSGKKRQDILDYIYFSYHKQSPYKGLLPADRKHHSIEVNELFDRQHQKNPEYYKVVEDWGFVGKLIAEFNEYTYSYLERQKLLLEAQVERFNDVLTDLDCSFDKLKEASDALKIITKQITEIEAQIARSDGDETKAVSKHLLELPEDHYRILKKYGLEK